MSQLFVLCGERGVGKDFLTAALTEHMKQYGVNVTRLSFSDEVRRIAYQMFPFLACVPNEEKNDPIYGHPSNPTNSSWREIIKSVGKLCRDVDPAYFAKAWYANQSSKVVRGSNTDIFVITDMRTQNEFDLLVETKSEYSNLMFIKIESETGLAPDDFEEWTRKFNGDKTFNNKRDEESVKAFCWLFETDKLPQRVNANMMCSLLEKQNSNNALYMGQEDWKSVSSFAMYGAAADREFSEFLDEISSEWAWWKKGEQTFDVNKAVVEFCDYICFKMSVFLLKYDNDVVDLNGLRSLNIERSAKGAVDFSTWYETIQRDGMTHIKYNKYEVHNDFSALIEEINITLDFFNLDLFQFNQTMTQVLDRNAERGQKIASGKVVNKQAEPVITTV